VENYIKQREELTAEEIRALRELILGYGRFIDCVRRLDMHPNTFRYILDRGHGNRRNITKIRAILLPQQYESHLYQQTANPAG
jgi:hypothetical protein